MEKNKANKSPAKGKAAESDVKKSRKAQMYQNEQLEALKDLRKRGLLSRQQFRALCFAKGLQQNPNKNPWSPMTTTYELVKRRDGTREVQVTEQQLVRFSK